MSKTTTKTKTMTPSKGTTKVSTTMTKVTTTTKAMTLMTKTMRRTTMLLALSLAPGCVMEQGFGGEPGADTPVLNGGTGTGNVTPGDEPGPVDEGVPLTGQKQPPGEAEGEKDPGEEPDEIVEPDPDPTMVGSARGNLVWKRFRAVELDLMRALSLSKDQVCAELGQFNCVDVVHLAPLGGNEPFELGQYEPVDAPTATTPIALDRVVLSACVARVEEDMTTTAAVFTDLDFNNASLSVAGDGAAIDATLTTLYRRLLSRDPLEAELEVARGLAEGISAEVFAKTSCYAIGTTVENFFY